MAGRYSLGIAAAWLATAAPASAPAAAQQATASTPAPVAAEASAFMDSYARDLIAGDREALLKRYDPRGVYLIGAGTKEFASPARLHQMYMEDWTLPFDFAWRDLSYEVLGPDAVGVTGLFEWRDDGETAARLFSYTALLVRRDGGLRIRLEHEDEAPPAADAADAPAPPAD